MNKLRKFFVMKLKIFHRNAGKPSNHYVALFNPCTDKDFLSNGIT